MEDFERDFKGIWIPADIWLDERLSTFDKIILMEIDSLDCSPNRCFAGNEHFSELCQCSERVVSASISKLLELGLIEKVSFNGRVRVLGSCLPKLDDASRQSRKICEADSQNMRGILEIQTDISKTINREVSIDKAIKETRDTRDTKELKVSNRFKKPSIDEIREYCKSKNYKVDAEKFYAYYESNGWKVGRAPMANWKMATVTWHKRQEEQDKAKPKVDPRYQNPWADDEEYKDLPF